MSETSKEVQYDDKSNTWSMQANGLYYACARQADIPAIIQRAKRDQLAGLTVNDCSCGDKKCKICKGVESRMVYSVNYVTGEARVGFRSQVEPYLLTHDESKLETVRVPKKRLRHLSVGDGWDRP